MMSWKVLLMSVVGGLAVLLQFEVQNDVLYTEKEVVLPGSMAKVFLYISDLRNLKYWFPGIDSFDPVDDTVDGVGKQYVETMAVKFYGNLSSTCTVLGHEPPKFVSFVCDSWLTRPRVEMILTRNEDNAKYPTLLTYKEYSRRRSYLFSYVFSPVIGYASTYLNRQALFSLRHRLLEKR